MLQRFWRTMVGLFLVIAVFTLLSWLLLDTLGFPLNRPNQAMAIAHLPTDFPSLWDLVSPSPQAASWAAPVAVLLVQVLLSGGLYGSLVRANLASPVGPGSFLSDALRSFWRLLWWNLLWAALYLVLGTLSSLGRGLPRADIIFGLPVLILRFLFLFADAALVAERHVGALAAITQAARALLAGFVPMLPYAVSLALLADAGTAVAPRLSHAGLLAAGLVYSLMVAWLLHMVTARYLYFSAWRSAPASDQPPQAKSLPPAGG
ncbi:hypothetical protein [Alicyclobacillus kakegawensis]|uniref:hypothetical protein n=1 Tax=Alicyclobacillus kakegawensis TaxID=392012 RepID=UPI00083546BC|nr:hypothetical protein [Alicyclobacillus kakegawensis]